MSTVASQYLGAGPPLVSQSHSAELSSERTATSRHIRALFVNTRDQIGADVAVHLGLLQHLADANVDARLITNINAQDADKMRTILQSDLASVNSRFADLGMPSSEMAGMSKLGKAASMAKLGVTLATLARQIQRDHIDILHTTDRPRDAFFATRLGMLTKTQTVVHMHCNCTGGLSRETLTGLRSANAVIAISRFIADELVDIAGVSAERVHTIHNATDAIHFNPDTFTHTRSEIRTRYSIPDGSLVIGTVARLIPWKGQRELIQAVAALSVELPTLHLMMVGEGPDLDGLKALANELGISNRIVFTGWHDDVRPILSSMDIFALPSYAEPFGLAITEAMAMRLPVIACNSGGVPEIITSGVDGLLVEARSSEALAGAISDLASRPEYRKSLGREARQTVISRFSPEIQADLVARLYRQLSAQRPRN